MGKFFSRFQNFTSVPSPASIRKYGIYILLLLGVPKITWDILRIRQASCFKSSIDDDEKKDPAIRVLRLAAVKALKDMQAVWERVLVPHCREFSTPIASLWQDITATSTSLTDDLALLDIQPKSNINNEKEMEDEADTNSDTDSDDDSEKDEFPESDGADDEAHDGFLEQWEENLDPIINSLYKVIDIKEDDTNKEKEIREAVKALLFICQAGSMVIKSQRRQNARLRYITAKKISLEQTIQDKTHFLYNAEEQESLKRNLDRSKKKLSDFYQGEGDELDNTFYFQVFSPTDFELNLTKFNNAKKNNNRKGKENANIAPTVLYEHWTRWREYRHRQRVNEYLETVHPKTKKWIERINVDYMKLACQARYVDLECDNELGSIRKQRFLQLINFVNIELCGGWKERTLIVCSWGLGAIKTLIQTTEWHYRSTLLIESIEATLRRRITAASTSTSSVAAAAATAATTAAAVASTAPQLTQLTLFDVCVSIFVLKATSGLLIDMTNKIQKLAFGSIRRGLQQRVAHTILSQDMEDAVGDPNKGGRRSGRETARIIRSLSDSEEWKYGLGSILDIPQKIIETSTTIMTTSLLLWGKSPKLLLLCLVADLFTKRLQDSFYTLQLKMKRYFGLDKNEWRGWVEMRSIEDAISNFEDMRINAKENDIEKNVIKTALLTENEENRAEVVSIILEPFNDMIQELPTLITAYVGGQMALGGGISAVDLTNFTYQIASLVQTLQSFRQYLESLWKMDSDSFSYALKMMDLLDSKPKMGIDGGWQPDSVDKEQETNESTIDRNRLNNIEDDANDEDVVNGVDRKDTVASSNGTNDTKDSVKNENHLSGDLVFDNVSFRYRGMPKNMLKHVSFTIKSGSFVGICGERGAGKSTMYKLIMRLYDPNEGSITIDGNPLNYYNPVWLRSRIGISVQEPQIFRFKTLKQNVLYGSEARFRRMGYGPIETEKHIEKVLRKANIWKHFQDKEKFPQGLATCCYNLSGGETRSVGTARALLKNPSILLLDEPTEGLDAENEEKVMHNIVGDRPKGQTVLAIAHRLSSIKNADLIIFLGKDGTIAEMGTWEELCEIKNGKFAKFESVQNLNRDKTNVNNEDDGEDENNANDEEESETDSVSTEDSDIDVDPLERAVNAVEALRLYVKRSDMDRNILSTLTHACDAVKEQHRLKTSMSSWGGWTPLQEVQTSTRKRHLLRQRSHHLRTLSNRASKSILKNNSLNNSTLKRIKLVRVNSAPNTSSRRSVHVSKHGNKMKSNKNGLRMASVF